MPLFSKRRDSMTEKPSGRPATTWCTNAPGHWPAIERKVVPETMPQAVHQLSFLASVERAFKASSSGCRLAAIMTRRLDPQGILEVTLEVEDGGTMVPVFLYPKADAESSARYAGAARFLEARGEPKPVYYAAEMLTDTAPGNPLRAFDSSDLEPWSGARPKEQFAMWWSTDGDTSAVVSPVVGDIGRAYRALDGIETYVFAAIMRQLKQVSAETGRVRLPKEGATFPLEGPEGRLIMLVASEDKGVQFMFPVHETPPVYRNAFWRVFAAYAEEWKKGATERNLRRDPPAETSPLAYWSHMEKIMDQTTKEGNPPEQIGLWLPA